MVWHIPQKPGVSENPTAATPPIVETEPNPETRRNRMKIPRLLRHGGWGILPRTRVTGAKKDRVLRNRRFFTFTTAGDAPGAPDASAELVGSVGSLIG
jgi:hypothetical protein